MAIEVKLSLIPSKDYLTSTILNMTLHLGRHNRYLQDNLHQKFGAKTKRLRRYRTANKKKNANSLFQRKESLFHRILRNETSTRRGRPPLLTEVGRFWREIWSKEFKHNDEVSWISTEEGITVSVL